MTIALVQPSPDNMISGGHLYNRNVLQQAGQHGFGLVSEVLSALLPGQITRLSARHELLFWDSLLLHDLQRHSAELGQTTSALLCHYLPSLNPNNDAISLQRHRALEDEVLKALVFVIVTGKVLYDDIKQRHPELDVFVCEPGIDTALFSMRHGTSKPDNRIVECLTVANLLPEKGYLDILAALAQLPARGWRWHIVGSEVVDPAFSRRFRAAANLRKLTQQINWHGALPQARVAELMVAADIFIFASYYESYAMVLAEAAALRLPMISTRVGAAEELITHGGNGFLFEPGDSDCLAGYLQRLIADTHIRRRFSNALHSTPRSWQQCIAEFTLICRQAIPEINHDH